MRQLGSPYLATGVALFGSWRTHGAAGVAWRPEVLDGPDLPPWATRTAQCPDAVWKVVAPPSSAGAERV